MNRKIYIPTHFNVGNRGCEGISKGTIKILNNYEVFLFSQDPVLDEKIAGLSNNLLFVGKLSIVKRNWYKILKRLAVGNKKVKRYYECRIRLPYFFEHIEKSKEGIVLVTGGDMFCYDDNYVVFLNRYINKDRFKSVLWGCSIGPENISKEKIVSLKQFDAIIARETFSRDFLVNELGIDKVYCCPDPAFSVEEEKCEIGFLLDNTIGINLSNFVSEDVSEESIFGKNIANLVEYIISKTNMEILLIPHVFWDDQDDRIICNKIYEKYKKTSRVKFLEAERMNYCQIRYVIGKCRFFIGARTHAMISAYAMCVPSLALGYSIKARGIAYDLGLPSRLVVDYKTIKDESEIRNAFCYLLNEENSIREHLQSVMSEYRYGAFSARVVLDKLIEQKEY